MALQAAWVTRDSLRAQTSFGREEERKKEVVGKGKKSAKIWAPIRLGPTLRGSHFLWVWPTLFRGLHPSGPPPFGAPQFGAPPSANTLAYCGCSSQIGPQGIGLNRLGHTRSNSEPCRPLVSPPSFAFALHCLHLPVWPSTRRFWPPPRSVKHSWRAWQKRIYNGKCHRADLYRARGPGFHERDASRPRTPSEATHAAWESLWRFDVVWLQLATDATTLMAHTRTPMMGRHWRRRKHKERTQSCATGTVAPRKPRISCGAWQVRRALVFPEDLGAHEQHGTDVGVVFWLVPQQCQWCWRSLATSWLFVRADDVVGMVAAENNFRKQKLPRWSNVLLCSRPKPLQPRGTRSSRAGPDQGVADADRSVSAGARRTEVNTSPASWWWRRECHVDGKRFSLREEHSIDAIVPSAGSDRNCDLRNAMEFGDPTMISKIGGAVGQGVGSARDFESRCVDGRPFEVFSHVIVDQDNRCQKTLCDRSDRRLTIIFPT